MAYEKTDWKTRKGTKLNRYKKLEETSASVVLENAPIAVTEPGTPFNPSNMNKMEQGIFDAHEMIANEERARTDHETNNNAHADIRTSIANESQERQTADQNLQGRINNESQKRARGDVEVLNTAKNYADQNTEVLSAVLDGVKVLRLSGALLTRVINGTTPVARILFNPTAVFIADKTIICDVNGTIGVCKRVVDSATIIVETLSISPISPVKKTLLGDVPTFADLPVTVDEAIEMDWSTPEVDDYANVLRDETHNNHKVEWYIAGIEDGVITWGNPVVINTSDYQAQTTAQDAGKALMGGETPGSFGESKSIDTVPTENSTNLVSSDAVFRYSGKKYADVVIGNVAAGHTANMVNYLCAGSYDEIVINEAMEELRASGGGKILLLKGQYNVSDSIDIIGDNIILQGTGNSTVINIVGSSDPNPSVINVTGNNSKISDFKIKNDMTGKNITYGIYNTGNHNVIENIFFDMGVNHLTVIYPIFDYGNYAIIKNNTLKFQSDYTIYGIVLHGNNAFVIENIIDIQSNYKAYCIYMWGGDKNTVHDNNISCRVLDYPNNAFALYYQSGDYNSFKGNNLSGVTRTSPAGSAFTVDGNTPSPMPGSAVSIGVLGNNGVCGFNAGLSVQNPITSRYLVSFKITDGADYLSFSLLTNTPHFANEISDDSAFINVTNAEFFEAMQLYFTTLNVLNKVVTIGGASGQWQGAFINHISLCLINSTTLRISLNTSNSAYTYEITALTNSPQFAVNVSMLI